MFRITKGFYIAITAIFMVVSGVVLAADEGTEESNVAKPAVVVGDSAVLRATIVKINKKTRELTLRDEQGAETMLQAGDEVRNFNQIKKGDIVEVEYQVAAASSLEKVSDITSAGEATHIERAPVGAKPGMAAVHARTIMATVLDADKNTRMLTVKGPKGGIVTIKVPAEIKAFDSLEKGDTISAEYAEAMAISVKTPEKK